MKKTIITLITVLALNMSAFAQCGNFTWKIENDTLTISGEGEMCDYTLQTWWDWPPWFSWESTITAIVIENGITRIGDFAFFVLHSATSVSIPNSVTSIGKGSFGSCESLPSITLPNSITSIGGSVFAGCANLTSIDVESENNSYASEDGVLFDKNKITLICCPEGKTGDYVIPNSVKTIGSWAFYYCENLTSITIPNSVKSIEDKAFGYCKKLKLITNLNPIPIVIDSDVFYEMNIKECTLEVPINSVDAYRNAAVWKEFNIVGVEVGIEETDYYPSLRIYPNPTIGKVYLETESSIKVYDVRGVFLMETFGNQVDLSVYPQGVYLLQVNGGRWIKVVRQ
ncbi:MAG: leucine-rich repeat protein [Bacteroidales bacterium]|nr:leucine-rich repeat protein [Bacteroidales bacterium]